MKTKYFVTGLFLIFSLICLSGFVSGGYDDFSVSMEINPSSQTVKPDEDTEYTISITLEDVGDHLDDERADCYLGDTFLGTFTEGQTKTEKIPISPPNIATKKTYSHTVTCYHTFWTTQESTSDSESTRITYTASPMSVNLQVNPSSVKDLYCGDSTTVQGQVQTMANI